MHLTIQNNLEILLSLNVNPNEYDDRTSLGNPVKNSGRKANQALLIFLSILFLAGVILIFQLEKANILPSPGYDQQSHFTSLPEKTAILPSPSIEDKPQITHPPPEVTHGSIVKPSNIPTLTITLTPTPIVLENGWYLYEDKEAGFSFSYPPEVHLSTSKEGFFDYKTVRIAFKPSGLGYQGMEINLFSNPDDLPLTDVVQKIYSYSGNIPSLSDLQNCLKPVTIGNVSAFKSTYQPALPKFIVFVPMQDKVLYAMAGTKMGLTDFAPSSQEMFDKILATLTTKP